MGVQAPGGHAGGWAVLAATQWVGATAAAIGCMQTKFKINACIGCHTLSHVVFNQRNVTTEFLRSFCGWLVSGNVTYVETNVDMQHCKLIKYIIITY